MSTAVSTDGFGDLNLFFKENDAEHQHLVGLGYNGTINDMQFNYLRAQGFTGGALSEMRASFQNAWWKAFEAGGFSATFVLGFDQDRYYNGTSTTIDSLVESARTSTKSAWDANGDIASIATTTPVIAYDPVTGTRLGVVTEPTINRINTYPVCLGGTGWSSIGATSSPLALNALGVFNGVTVSSTGATWNRLDETSATASVTNADVIMLDYYYRIGTSGRVYLLLLDTTNTTNITIEGVPNSLAVTNAAAGTVSNLTETLLLDGLTYRVSFSLTKTTTGALKAGIGPSSATSGETIIALGAFIGAAGEKLPACPILGSDGSTVTTDDDDLSTVVDGANPYTGYEQTKVSGKITLTPNDDGALSYISYNDGTANEVIEVHQDASNNIRLTVTDGGVVQCDIDSLVNAVIGTEVTIAFRAGANDFAISVDGNTEQTDGAGTMPTVTDLEFGGFGICPEHVAYNELITDLAGLSE